MSVRVNSGSMLLGRTAGFQSMNGIGTWSFLARLRSDTNDYAHIYAQTVENDEIAGDYTNSQFIGTQPDGTTAYGASYVGGSGAGGGSTTALTVDTWVRHTFVRESATVLKYYKNNTLVETITQDVSTRAAQGGEWFGRLNGGYPADVAIEGFICWNVALTAGEVATQAGYLNPAVQSGSVTTYVPMTDAVLANALVATTGTNLSVIFGTPTVDTNSGYAVFSGGVAGDSATTLGNATLSATGNPEINAAATPTLSGVGLSADGTVSQPPSGVTADASPTLGNATLSATGSLSINGAATPTLGNLSSASVLLAGWTVRTAWDDITGEDGYRVKLGTASGTYDKTFDTAANVTQYDLPNLQAGTTYYTRVYGLVGGVEQDPSAEISFTVGVVNAAGAVTLGAVTASSTANPEITGASTPTLGTVTVSADGTVVGSGILADAAIALGGITLAGTGSIEIVGSATPTLSSIGLTADGNVVGIGVAASAAMTLDNVTPSAAGTVQSSVGADGATTLGNLGLSAGATVSQPSGAVAGDAAVTLGDAALSATGAVQSSVTADGAAALQSIGLEAAAWVTPSPTLDFPVLLYVKRGLRPHKRKFVRMFLRKGTRNMNLTNVVAGTPVAVDMSESPVPITVAIHPGAGNTSKVEYSLTPGAANNEGAARWITWPAGTVSVPTSDVIDGPISALRFTRVSGGSNDTFEVVS